MGGQADKGAHMHREDHHTGNRRPGVTCSDMVPAKNDLTSPRESCLIKSLRTTRHKVLAFNNEQYDGLMTDTRRQKIIETYGDRK